jgi:thiaminase
MNFHDRYHQNNNNFTEKMAANISKTIDAIINHPYISALEKKEISKEKLEVIVCEQYHIIANDRKNVIKFKEVRETAKNIVKKN